MDRQTDRTDITTFPQVTYAGGKKVRRLFWAKNDTGLQYGLQGFYSAKADLLIPIQHSLLSSYPQLGT